MQMGRKKLVHADAFDREFKIGMSVLKCDLALYDQERNRLEGIKNQNLGVQIFHKGTKYRHCKQNEILAQR